MKSVAALRIASAAALLAACNNDWQPSESPLLPPGERREPVYASGSATAPVAPLSGGTLAILRDGLTAVAADPERDRVSLVDLAQGTVRAQVSLRAGDEPGRVVAGLDGHAYVALRRGGAVVDLDVQSGTVVSRRAVCAAPRGLSFDASSSTLHVACTDGALVTLDARTGTEARRLALPPDLRDVVPGNGGLYVTRFRSAEVLWVSAAGAVSRVQLEQDALGSQPSVAWRAVSAPRGGLVVVHQLASTNPVNDAHSDFGGGSSGAYGSQGPCGGLVRAAVTRLDGASGPQQRWSGFSNAVLPVDVALRGDGSGGVFVAAGNASLRGMPQLLAFGTGGMAADARGSCGGFNAQPSAFAEQPNGQVTAAAYDAQDRLVVQTREPAALYLVDEHRVVRLPGESLADQGHGIFHGNTGSGIACASCHPEGGDDGHTWNFTVEGPRRTQPLQGTFTQGGPFHWSGDLQSFDTLVSEVFVNRMAGPRLEGAQQAALSSFLTSVQAPLRGSMSASAERGRAVFERADTACASCHAGDALTDHRIVAVGTGGAFRVPSLRGVSQRLPVMHNGCATSLLARFTDPSCGGGDQHGRTSQLSPQELADLVAYLGAL